ncbi:MAG TPA: indolepyruvate ferredoxin oxidoreductase family protein [Xanthobacteraceae bacterium]|nr:indolepyruvate ferredoxin oxidoreductase family protein [Xanthobacteraceae bacterium]
MALRHVTLDDKYDLTQSRVFVTGFQALVRLCLMQRERDRRAGLNTAGLVTGYRGSPLGGLDQQLERAQKFLDAAHVRFQPGINEDLAATALWGTQQAELRGEGRYDGVFGMWYGKGPGVDRTGDVFRHANLAGTSPHGGVLAVAGDDHTASSSTTAHQSEFRFVDVLIPVLVPANLQEILDYGLYGWAMSRFTGCWSAMKVMQDTVEATGIVDGSLERLRLVAPADFAMPPGGLHIRLRDPVPAQEARLYDFKRDAIAAFLRANSLTRTVTSGGSAAKVGVITVGKAYGDVRQALDELGLDELACNKLGLRLLKLGCAWPLIRDEMVAFARGLDLVIVVEEKEALVETQLRALLYGTASQPAIIGKKDEQERTLFSAKGALDVAAIAACIGDRLLKFAPQPDLAARVAELKDMRQRLSEAEEVGIRRAYFCSGCPHNTSTVVPEGMRAYAGIGCHYMAQWMDRSTLGFTQMGGEGANWMGEALFSTRNHVFQNIGDGTYNHSGSLAIRAAVAAGINVTYKILFNDAVAMTGGQANDGMLTVPLIAKQMVGEAAARVVVVTDEPQKYSKNEDWPRGVTIHHRDELMAVQTGLAAIPGVTVLIYDQTCAAEKRRRRKRGLYPDPDKRVIINELVCEGCGDCGVQSNCVSIQPLETEFGRKRKIDQSSCNKDYSCLKGFCPSLVTVHGGKPKRRGAAIEGAPLPGLPPPSLPSLDAPYGIIVTGIGGTGVVTIGGILGMAAHLEGKGAGVIDMSGLAQKGGPVHSHIRIAARPEDIHAIRVPAGGADLVLGGDIVVAGSKTVLAAVKQGKTRMVVNLAEFLPGEFTRDADFALPTKRIERAITEAAGREGSHFVDATRMASGLLGNSIGANIFLLGYAFQLGTLPLSAAAIEQAIALNGEAVAMNHAAFRWGRVAAADPAAVEALLRPQRDESADDRRLSESFGEMVERRAAFLSDYQDAAYATRYRSLVERAKATEAAQAPGKCGFAEAVARYLFKLMAYKDEYEVARLYADGSFARQLKAEFEGDVRLEFHLAPPLFAPRDPATGLPRKLAFGGWVLPVFRALAKLKFLRGTSLDPFGYTQERKTERKLAADYEAMLSEIMPRLTPDNHHLATGLAAIPEKIRGFGHVKARHLAAAKAEEAALLEQFRAGASTFLKAAE